MKNYSYHLETQQSAKEVFGLLLDIKKWWSGIYDETITGNSKKLNDEFSFSAGGGMHFTKQKLVELVPNKKIVWEVMESKLSFLDNPEEWEHTKLQFEITEEKDGKTKLGFTHEGLMPNIECYEQCSSAWTKYLHNLQEKLSK
ncbi:MAG: SRPBCC domain-containing protein [Bacteroidetes bacterium]|nr:SRPBCC domain-containing protein [Bacteroidota bacterium]